MSVALQMHSEVNKAKKTNILHDSKEVEMLSCNICIINIHWKQFTQFILLSDFFIDLRSDIMLIYYNFFFKSSEFPNCLFLLLIVTPQESDFSECMNELTWKSMHLCTLYCVTTLTEKWSKVMLLSGISPELTLILVYWRCRPEANFLTKKVVDSGMVQWSYQMDVHILCYKMLLNYHIHKLILKCT